MKKLLTSLLLSSLVISNAYAEDFQSFTCPAENGSMVISVVQNGEHITYTYGKMLAEQPDIVITENKEDAKPRGVTGAGFTFYASDFRNEEYTYSVLSSKSLKEDKIMGVGVVALKNNEVIAAKPCDNFIEESNRNGMSKEYTIATIKNSLININKQTLGVVNKGGQIKVSEGVYKVGVDIPAGEYRLNQTSRYGAFYRVTKDSSGSIESIIAGGNFKNNAYITVKDGQYLELSMCDAVKVN